MQVNKIISLVPSITETLFYLGLGDKVAGITKWCKYPENEIKNLPKIGGVKGLDFDLINKINPDLIIAIKEENNKDEVLKLSEKYNVFVGDVYDIESSVEIIKEIGKLCSVEKNAEKLVYEINKISKEIKIFDNLSCSYFIWNNPMMVVGNKTFINDVLQKSGLKNVFDDTNLYIQITDNDIIKRKPNAIFLSSEPFKFMEKHKIDFQNRFPFAKIILVDGEFFTWYGSHFLQTADYLKKIF